LQPIADAIANNDPCLALQLIDQTAGPARDAYTALASSINSTNTVLDVIANSATSDPLVEASRTSAASALEQQINTAVTALNSLDQTYESVVAAATSLTETGNENAVAPNLVRSDLMALSAATNRAATSTVAADLTIEWTQIATGTWNPEQVDLSGTTERDGSLFDYPTVQDDPLQLAALIFDSPNTLVEILRSAPSVDNTRIEWTVPDDVLPRTGPWAATADVVDGTLRSLTLVSNGTTVVMTPAR
jgi:hypothetical protein